MTRLDACFGPRVCCPSGDPDTVSLDWPNDCCAGIEMLFDTDVEVMSMSSTTSKSAPPTECPLSRSAPQVVSVILYYTGTAYSDHP